MIDFTVETQIARPVHDVFAYATDPDRLSTWQTNTVSAQREDDGPYGVGSRLREVHRAPGGKELESVVEVVEYVPDRVFALEVKEGTPIHAHMTFDPAGARHPGAVPRTRQAHRPDADHRAARRPHAPQAVHAAGRHAQARAGGRARRGLTELRRRAAVRGRPRRTADCQRPSLH